MKASIRRGLTVEQISLQMGMSVAGICLALEQFGLDYYELIGENDFCRIIDGKIMKSLPPALGSYPALTNLLPRG